MAKKAAPKRQRASDSRWITVHERFDYYWSRLSMTEYTPGVYRVKNEVADFGVQKGYATEGKAEGQDAGTTADSGPDDAVAQPDLVDADRPAGGEPVDPDAK
jgi:hypothetical protein